MKILLAFLGTFSLGSLSIAALILSITTKQPKYVTAVIVISAIISIIIFILGIDALLDEKDSN